MCPYPNPGRYEDGKPLKQGMRVAFSGDTSVDRELLEDRATEAGLHVASSISRLTSLLVTNDPDSGTSKVARARQFGTPIVDEAAFGQLLRDVEVEPTGEAPLGAGGRSSYERVVAGRLTRRPLARAPGTAHPVAHGEM